MALSEFVRLQEQDEQFFQVRGSAKKGGAKKGTGTYYLFFIFFLGSTVVTKPQINTTDLLRRLSCVSEL